MDTIAPHLAVAMPNGCVKPKETREMNLTISCWWHCFPTTNSTCYRFIVALKA